MVSLVIEALRDLGHTSALVVHGEPGLDEISPMGPTIVAELSDGLLSESTVRPEDFDMKPCLAEELKGGGPEENAQIIMTVLRGENKGGARSAVLLNAGAAIYVSGIERNLKEGVESAIRSLDSGKALGVLNLLRSTTPYSADG